MRFNGAVMLKLQQASRGSGVGSISKLFDYKEVCPAQATAARAA
jgi:hypothetical protein